MCLSKEGNKSGRSRRPRGKEQQRHLIRGFGEMEPLGRMGEKISSFVPGERRKEKLEFPASGEKRDSHEKRKKQRGAATQRHKELADVEEKHPAPTSQMARSP